MPGIEFIWNLITKLSSRKRAVKETSGPGIKFICNICGDLQCVPAEAIGREIVSCDACHSTVRTRAVIDCLTRRLLGKSLSLAGCQPSKDLVGYGLSDWEGYASRLAGIFSYQNTYYHKDPRLDITSIPYHLRGTADFLISSDVFEHVPPPAAKAFEGAFQFLKPGGVLILTVPYTLESATVEHFPELHDYQIFQDGEQFCLRNITRDRREQIFRNLVFHGGEGETLEMRVFCEKDILTLLSKAGFVDIRIHGGACVKFGIVWEHDWSLPITACKPLT